VAALAATALLAACALNAAAGTEPAAPSPRPPPPAACAAPPVAPVAEYEHKRNRALRKLGRPRFRGIDLIASERDEVQELGGKLAYTAADKDLQDERVYVYACVERTWRSLGAATTDGDGRFAMSLRGPARLPRGLRDLYLHVPGHGGGVRFSALVIGAEQAAIVSDVDGTLTESENAILDTVLFGDDIDAQPRAARALTELAARGHPIIYLTARGDQLTDVTRRWLAARGFPRGPLRLVAGPLALPGERSAAYKRGVLARLPAPLAAGIGNRASDIAAYTAAGLPPRRILIYRAELSRELGAELAAGRAVGFDDYGAVPGLVAAP
jgi:hypothetical protein